MAYLDKLFPPTASAMPSTRPTSEGSKKRALPFKAPRPVGKTSTHAATTKDASKTTRKTSAASSKSTKVAKKKSLGNGKGRAVVISSDEEDELDKDDDEEEEEEEQEEVESTTKVPARSKPKPGRVEADSDEDIDMDEEEGEEEEAATPRPAPKSKTKTKSRTAELDEIPGIPTKLLTRLLYEGFEDKHMKIGKDAMAVVGKYMETFVREAIARAVHERGLSEDGVGEGDFLQVEDLEKLAPQLLLDF
ncbi:hypothetical protein EJ08DRAFT_696308 [Tothia fuscella]|uniref:Centromere protein X n=1 Tax=Tothia fuscella TaxID=1048955 RepID=A0A9P4U021_9PEZI|nr:hypothetical protein EJ08DRAFT_696308 [Tothia fuscella]